MSATLPPHLRSQRENLAKAFPEFTFAVLSAKVFVYRKGAQTPFVTFERDGQLYKNEHKCVSSIRDILEWARSNGLSQPSKN